MGEKIDDEFYKKNPKVLEKITPLESSLEAKELYNFIVENPYTINRSGGMGGDVIIAPDMSKLLPIGQEAGIDVYTYKDYFMIYVNKQREEEEKFRKQQESK